MRKYLHWPIVGILLFFPVALFVVPRGSNGTFYLLLIFALFGIACRSRPMGKSIGVLCREYWPLNLAMAGLLIAILLHQLATGEFRAREIDQASRLACFVLLFWLFLHVPPRQLKHFQWGLVAGAAVCAASLYIYTKAGTLRPGRLFDVPLIPFGNIGLIMGLLALFSIGWNKHREKVSIAFKLMAGALALYGSYLSQSRGGWIALPAFVFIAMVYFGAGRLRTRLALAALALALLGSAAIFSESIQGRIHAGETEWHAYFEEGRRDSSIGHRLMLWRASLLLFAEQPWTGTGLEHFPEALKELAGRNEITTQAASQPHTHNELLFFMATRGVPGMLAILALYLVPAVYFFRERRHPDRDVRTTAAMGMVLTTGFFLIGMTDVMFYWTASYIFYVILAAAIFASLVQSKTVAPNPLNARNTLIPRAELLRS